MLTQNLFLNFEFDLEKGFFFYPLGKNYIRQTTVGLYDPESSIEMENAELGGIDCCSVCQAQSSLKVRELLT